MKVTDKGTVLWVKHRRDGTCLIGEDCDWELVAHLIDEDIGDVESNIITLCGKHHDDAVADIISKSFLRRIMKDKYGYEI